jgi:hypothetical protein
MVPKVRIIGALGLLDHEMILLRQRDILKVMLISRNATSPSRVFSALLLDSLEGSQKKRRVYIS